MRPTAHGIRNLDRQHRHTVSQKTLRVKSPHPTVGIVINTQNLLGGAFEIGGRRVDYRRIVADIAGDRPWTAVACVARPLTGSSIEAFVAYLGHLGLETAIWESPVAGHQTKVNLDTLVIREAMRLLYTEDLEELCLAAGDVDNYVLAEACANAGVSFTVAGFPRTIGTFLRQHAGKVLELDRVHLGEEVA
jgi:uncharacterized LabA/DUF88 family protein